MSDNNLLQALFAETPAVETPAVETPAVETPAVETPAVDDTIACSQCDCEISRDDALTLASGEAACEDCALWCERCEEYHTETTVVRMPRRHHTEHWCEDCVSDHAFHCGDCGNTFHEDMGYGDNTSGDTVCEACAESYFSCEGCQDTIHVDYARHGDDGIYCRSCYSSREDSEIIHCHSYKPIPVFHPSRDECDKSRAYGVELEVESMGDRSMGDRSTGDRDNDAERVQSIMGDFVYLKHDGSLHDGFEIVSHPATLAYHREKWQEFFTKRPRSLRSASTSTCGLHIHARRKGMTSLQIAKIVCFVNSPSNCDLVTKIARRDGNSYCKKYDKKLSSAHRDPDRTRYQAVNLEPYNTIEFRLFKGTLSYVQFTQALEFVDAIIEYCAPASRSIAESLRGDSFNAYVTKNKKQWPALARLLSQDSVNTTTTQETGNN